VGIAHAVVADIASAHRRRDAVGGRQTVLIGLIGRSIRASRSPIMHQREGERLSMIYTYALIDFDEAGLPDDRLGDVIASAEAAGFAGVNVTHPFKVAAIDHLNALSPEAEAVGAVNTIVFRAGIRTGHNTDVFGFDQSFRTAMAGSELSRVLLLGAGGGGAAVGQALLDLGAGHVMIHDLEQDRAHRLAGRLSARFGRPVEAVRDVASALRSAAGVVNATPVGMAKYPGTPFDTALLRSDQWVADIVYFPAATELLTRAGEIGCRTLPGTGMAVFQAARAFELFTGVTPDREAMARHFEAAA
jgi:shikimate dehydrogenase